MKKRAIGLEIADQAIYFIEVMQEHGKIVICHKSIIPLSPGIVVHGEIKELDKLTQALKPLVKPLFSVRQYLYPISLMVGIPGLQAFIRKLSIPSVSSKEMDEIVRWEGESILPCPIEEVLYGYQLIGHSNGENQFLFTALPKARTENYLTLLQTLKIPVEILTLQPFGLINYVDYIGELVDFSGVLTRFRAESMDLVLVFKGKIELVRTVDFPQSSIASQEYSSLTPCEEFSVPAVQTLHPQLPPQTTSQILPSSSEQNIAQTIPLVSQMVSSAHLQHKAQLFLREVISTLEHFQYMTGVWLNSGLYFGDPGILQIVRTYYPTFHWRHIQLDYNRFAKSVPNSRSGMPLSEELVELPCTLGLCLAGVI